MTENLTKIMWLEESPFIIDQFKNKAKDYELELVPFNCWEDAKDALKSNVKGWGAIILNPQCKLGKGDRPKPQRFLPQVFCDITSISAKYNVIIPWYIFTSLQPSIFEDLVIKDREVFDAQWERPYYSMDEDSDNLFARIKMQTSSIERTKIRQGIHKDLFDKMNFLTSYCFVPEDIATMEDILISLYENKESKRCNFVNLRKIIESLFNSMIQFKILPNDLRNSMGEVNLTACARLLAGMKCSNNGYEYHLQDTVLDNIAAYNLFNILNVCHGYAHAASSTEKRKDTNVYLDKTQTNNLLHSCALQLADIILMYFYSLRASNQDSSTNIYWTKD